MKLLLDTHAFLWYFTADPRLSKTAVSTIGIVQNELFFSMASVWEIGIKSSIGKPTLPGPFTTLLPSQMKQAGISLLNIEFAHVAAGTALPFHHKDPFDRMIAAQCIVEQLPLLSSDPIFDQYGIQRIW